MGQLVTVMESPHLTDGCDVAKDAVAALVAGGWTPPGRLPGLESGQHPTAEANHGQDEADQDHPDDVDRQGPAGTYCQKGDYDTHQCNQEACSDEARARTIGLSFPHIVHGPSISQPIQVAGA